VLFPPNDTPRDHRQPVDPTGTGPAPTSSALQAGAPRR
jgi:hypothetical protein